MKGHPKMIPTQQTSEHPVQIGAGEDLPTSAKEVSR